MQDFIARHRSRIIGVLRGFDRIVFRGTLSRLLYPEGVAAFLNRQGCLLKDFGHFVQATTGALRTLATSAAVGLGRPVHYLESSSVSKEEVARKFFEESPVKKGLWPRVRCGGDVNSAASRRILEITCVRGSARPASGA